VERVKAALRLGGLAAAIVLALAMNVFAARHFKRWDWTTGQRYTLTPATLETLHDLSDEVDVWVMLGSGDPLSQSVKQILVSYTSETTKLEVHSIDPDRDGAALVDVRERFGVEAGRAEDGRVVTDAVIVVAHGDKHWFITADDLFEVTAADDVKAKPHEEQAITGAIRNVLGSTRARLCFTAGQGELGIEPSNAGWIGGLRGILEKDNYEVVAVDVGAPDARDPFKGCDVVIVARPTAPFSAEESERLRAWLASGGSALVAIGPTPNGEGMEATGLDSVLGPFGIGFDDDLVLDPDPTVAITETNGEGFFATAKAHAITEALVANSPSDHPPRIAVLDARSLHHVGGDGAAMAIDLLETSDQSYGVRSFKGASEWREPPPPAGDDPRGPLVLAMASERAKASKDAAHGPRLAVVGCGFFLADVNWRQPRPVRGAAFFVESAISWLASRAKVLDVPDRPSVAAGIRITEASRSEVARYVLLYMPLAAALLGLAVGLRRRSTEAAAYKRRAAKAK
jgi:hypothetical protein